MPFPDTNRLASLPFLSRLWPGGSVADETVPRRPKTGLALSSGGAKGLAHIGVIQVLEERGIEIDLIAGTSMGSYIGACWASGLNGKEMEELAGRIKTPRDRMRLLDPTFPPRKGFLRGKRVRNRLRRAIGDCRFEQLQKPLLVIATEMGTYESHILSSGDVAEAVHASSAIPGICWPVEIDGKLFVDGGVATPLPVKALFEAGMDQVIAVNVIPSVADLQKQRHKAEHTEGPTHGIQRLKGWLNKHFNYFASGNILDTLRSSALGAQIRVAEFNGNLADIHLRPKVCTGNWHDYHHSSRYIRAGRVCAEAALPRLFQLGSSRRPPFSPLNPTTNHAKEP